MFSSGQQQADMMVMMNETKVAIVLKYIVWKKNEIKNMIIIPYPTTTLDRVEENIWLVITETDPAPSVAL